MSNGDNPYGDDDWAPRFINAYLTTDIAKLNDAAKTAGVHYKAVANRLASDPDFRAQLVEADQILAQEVTGEIFRRIRHGVPREWTDRGGHERTSIDACSDKLLMWAAERLDPPRWHLPTITGANEEAETESFTFELSDGRKELNR